MRASCSNVRTWLLCSCLLRAALNAGFARAYESHDELNASDNVCDQIPAHVIAAANLTSEEADVLDDICWSESRALTVAHSAGLGRTPHRNGIPPGVVCEKTLW